MISIYQMDVVFREIPERIALAFSICGCGGPCQNCHSPFLHDKSSGTLTSLKTFEEILLKYQNYIEVVLFLGGEFEDCLTDYLKLTKSLNFKTALYTNLELDELNQELLKYLDYLKVGKYIKELGGLDSETTNQRLYIVDGMIDITNKFLKRKELL